MSKRQNRSIRNRKRKGAAVLELAIAATILFTLTFGLVEFGYAFYCKNMLSEAARNGARAGIVPGGSYTSVSNAVASSLASTKWPSYFYLVEIYDMSGNNLNGSLSTQPAGTQFQVIVYAAWVNVGAGFNPLHLLSNKVLQGTCVARKEG